MSEKKTAGLTAVATETINGAKELCRTFHEKNIPTYLHSAPGIGKSAIMAQLAAEKKIGFKDIRVGTMLPEDLTGIPVPDLEKRVAVWLRANFWPDEKVDGAEGIIAFDELSDASKNLQSCIYRVVLDRQIGDFKLPDGWWPMAAGNRREDRAAAQSISTALANRFAHLHIRADKADWKAWANQNDIDPMLVGFIDFRENLLHCMDGADLLAFPTPRSWAMASKVFQSPNRQRLLRAIVGDGAAAEVEAFFKVVNLPDLRDILKDPDRAFIPDEPASRYALSSMLARNIDDKNFQKIYTYISRSEYGADFSTVVILDACKRDSSLTDSKTFIHWAKNNKSIKL